MNKKQRYRCNKCKFHYTTNKKQGLPESIKRKALHLYLEGLGFRSIGRILGVSNVSVLKWIRKYGKNVSLLRREDKIDPVVIEVDEMWHYIGKKNEKFGFGLLFHDTEEGLSIMRLVLGEHTPLENSGNE